MRQRVSYFVASSLCVGLMTVGVLSHPDDPKARDTKPAYEGPGYRRDNPLAGEPEFPAENVTLMSWLPVGEFGNQSWANDCWGYTSPSGREYAIIGLSDGTGFAEITNPGNAQVIDVISGPNSTWRDIKIYDHYAYAVSEGGNGIQVIDLAQIDSGVVTLVNTVTEGGTSATHNVAIDTTSGFLYRTGGGDNGLRIYDLSDPANPEYVGGWFEKYVHDAQIVTYESGPYAGRQIAFCCAGFNGGWVDTGLSIVDVTDKSNPVTLAHYQYSNNAYSHQGWLSPDRQYFYLDDELDEQTFGTPTTTRVLNVSDLENPFLVGTFTSGSNSIDHNLYTRDHLIYEANYESGIRIFDATDPEAPVPFAFFDTVPGSDSANFNGLWSCYPFFDSGMVIGSDRERGLFVWKVEQPLLDIGYPQGRPEVVQSSGGTSLVVSVDPNVGEPDPNGVRLHVNDGQGFVEVAMSPIGGNQYEALFPPTTCGATVDYYVSAETLAGDVWLDPSEAPAETYSAVSAEQVVESFADSFEQNLGWTVSGNASTGQWQRGLPAGDGDRGDPTVDGDGSGRCYLTGNAAGDTDVDGGSTVLTSPVMDGSIGDPVVSYWRWYDNSTGGDPMNDVFEVEISNDGGATWTDLETVGPGGSEVTGGWYHVAHRVADFVTPTDQIRLRFTASDVGSGSVIEAAVDGVELTAYQCGATTLTDVDVTAGTLIAGGLGELGASDDAHLRTRSQFGVSAFEPNVAEILVGAQTSIDPATLATLTIESRVNNPGGTAKVRLRNWTSGANDQIDQYQLGLTDATVVIADVPAGEYVRSSDGRIELTLRHVVVATFSAQGFDSFFDLVGVEVE